MRRDVFQAIADPTRRDPGAADNTGTQPEFGCREF